MGDRQEDRLEAPAFARRVGEALRVAGGSADGPHHLVVDRVETYDAGTRFSVFLRGAAPLLPQGTYRAEADGLAPFDLFVVPIREVDGGYEYEAAYNRAQD